MAVQLVVIAGPDQGHAFPIPAGEPLALGRGKEAQLRLSDPFVSRIHCRVQVQGGRLLVHDSGSRGSTLVGGRGGQRHLLGPGDVFQVGQTMLRVQGDPVPAAEGGMERLSQIETLWSMVLVCHGDKPEAAQPAREQLLERYRGAARRYLCGAVSDPDVAEELLQEFCLRFLRGDFRRADRRRGRFRDYLKTALSHLITDYRRDRQKAPAPLPPGLVETAAPQVEDESDFLAGWREAILQRSLEALARVNASYHAVLAHHLAEPELTSAQRAERLSALLGKPITAAWVRKNQQRAQEKLADLLIDEVAQTLETASEEALQEELRTLDLLKYCRPALIRWGSRRSGGESAESC